jgi:hypothetical protein
LFLFINHKQAGMPVFKNSLGGKFTIHSIKSASIKFFLISYSSFCLDVKEPLARTKPAFPLLLR